MPLVDVTLYQGRTPEQKHALALAISEAFVEIGQAKRDSVHVIFRDVDPEEWFKSADLMKDAPQ